MSSGSSPIFPGMGAELLPHVVYPWRWGKQRFTLSRRKAPAFTHGDGRRTANWREIIATFVCCEKNVAVVLLHTDNPIVFAGSRVSSPG